MGKKLEENDTEKVVAQKDVLGDVLVSVKGDESIHQTLPKAQRTRGLSSHHKFKHKS